jgi:phosphopantothenoylcysteine decarboxylase / phosphopantothenate---cysteine ligase
MRILIGVTGGIAAYKAVETARLAIKAGHAVRVIQTPTSERFVGRATFAAITGAPVLVDEFEQDSARGTYPGEPLPEWSPISHLALVENADVFLIAPASANTLAKLAAGFADNLVTTAALAASCPVAVAPAMNNRMYLHPATQANLALLDERGVTVIPPGSGDLASRGEAGVGRLAEPAELLAACESLGSSHEVPADLAGVAVLVTAGGTQEAIDSVRFIGNHSSGRMGFAVAETALRRGAEVTVIAANVNLPVSTGIRVIRVRSAAELQAACTSEFANTDVLVMAAAVADFRPRNPADHKLKKTGPDPLTNIELEPTADILSELAQQRRPEQTLVGFAAEHGDEAVEYGREKLTRKGLDAIVVNDISRTDIGFDSAENEVTILTRDDISAHVEMSSKAEVAAVILDQVVRLRASGNRGNHGAGTGTRAGFARD